MTLDRTSPQVTAKDGAGSSPYLLEDREVHVWICSTACDQAQTAEYARLLSPAEASKAAAFRFEEDRKRSIDTHGILRKILSRYLPMDPAELVFGSAPGGKPFLHPTPAGESVRFNLSHTKGLVAFAITRTADVGIDIEYIREVPRMDAILARFLSPAQCQDVKDLPPEDRTRAFFRWWTASEALLKARGQGISALGESLDFVPVEGPASALHISELNADRQWSVWSHAVEPDHIMAIAAKGDHLSLRTNLAL